MTGKVKWFNKAFTVYRIARESSLKCYIGWTSLSPQERFSRHCKVAARGSQTYFHTAIRRYGTNCWTIEVLAVTDSLEEAKSLERKFISEYGSSECGYNLTAGGDGFSDPTGKIRRKISRTLKGRGRGVPKPEWVRLRMRVPKNPNHGLHTSEARMGMKFSPQHRSSLSLAKLGRRIGPASEERKQKIRESLSYYWEQKRKGSS